MVFRAVERAAPAILVVHIYGDQHGARAVGHVNNDVEGRHPHSDLPKFSQGKVPTTTLRKPLHEVRSS